MKNTANAVSVVTINRNSVKELIHSVKDGKIFSIRYGYRHPKCGACGHKSVKFERGLDTCPKCGGAVVFERITLAQKGVENPANATKPGCGYFDGMSADEAERKYNLFKHYDRNCGSYRQADFDKIYELQIDGVKYIVQ